jgi:hypothetical protein
VPITAELNDEGKILFIEANFLGSVKRLWNSFWINIYDINKNPPTNKIKSSFE